MADNEITLYYVGNDEAEATDTLPFDSFESAESYRKDTGALYVYTVSATIRFETIEQVK